MTFLLQVTLILLVRLSELWAYPGGPPLSTCDFMTPHHRGAKPQTVMAPYNITVSKSAYTTGENLTVTISGTKTFKGFILRAQGTDSAVAWPVGEFNQVPNGAQYVYCSGGEPKNTVAHNNPGRTEWNSREFTWMAPAKSAGNITFVATVVENFSTFWTKVMSSVVSGPPAEVVTRGAPTESFQIDKTGCGKTKGCYSLPSNCAGSSDCTYLFTYQVSGESVTMEMSAKQRWASVAFNEQKKMDKMDAIMCATMATNLAELRHYYSNNHNLIRQNLAGNSDITLNKIVYEDGGIKCKMTRKLNSNEAHFRDLTKKWYLIFAHGKTSPSGSAQYHHENKSFIGDMVNISVAAVLVDEQSQAKETIDKTGCGKTKGCYSLPSNCAGSSDCTYLFTYQVSGESVTMEMSAKQRWASVAFNEQKKMDKMDAIMCATMATNLAELRHYYSNNHNLIRQNLAGNSDITLNKIVYEDGGIKCKMTRKLNSNEAHFRDLTKKWYLIFAHGKTSPSGSAQYHHENKTFTGDMVNISVAAVLVDEQSQAKETINKDGCGETKSCYSEPESCKSSSDCDYLVAIRPVGENDDSEVEFELSSKEQWVAIGFNKEKNKMPDTDALICADVNGKVSVDHYVADKGYDPPTKTTPRPSSLDLVFGESKGGVLSCRIRRKKKDDKMVDLTQSWYLVYASGPMRGDSIGQHSSHPKTSAEKIDVNKIGVLGAEEEGSGMIQAHGCLMVIAWVGFASIGIFMARYMKVAFGEKVLLGTKVWFTFHRSLMVLTVLVTIISIIIIFVHAGRWTKEAGAHPVTGIIVLVLAVIQPIMALFRPHPGEANRYIFNWAHRGVGLSALIMAVVTVFLGIRLPDASLDDSALYAMIVYCVGVAIVIAFDVFLSFKKDDRSASFSPSGGEKDAGGHVQLEEPAAGDKFVSARQLMLGFLVALVTGVTIALVVLIATAGGEGAHEH